MKKLLLLGAGRSAGDFIAFYAHKDDVLLTVADQAQETLSGWKAAFPSIEILCFTNLKDIFESIASADLVVSLLPPALHVEVAKACLEGKTSLATASYVSAEMSQLHQIAKEKQLIFLNECGLDPGIDHLSTMKMLDAIGAKGGEVYSYESYCGGLVAAQSVGDNPWQYKFSWNPRNVVLAGQSGAAVFKQDGAWRVLPPTRLFAEAETLWVPGIGEMQAYANRDSASYMPLYRLTHATTFKRGTLRRGRFCNAWQVLLQSGLAQDIPLPIEALKNVQTWLQCMTGFQGHDKLSNHWIGQGLMDSAEKEAIDYLELETANEKLDGCKTSVDVLQRLLERRWKMEEQDVDEVVMMHRIGYRIDNEWYEHISTLQVFGKDRKHTAMSKTVGLPLALASSLILEGNVSTYGVVIPLTSEWYKPILAGLEAAQIRFVEEERRTK